jgi:hypothetical protein
VSGFLEFIPRHQIGSVVNKNNPSMATTTQQLTIKDFFDEYAKALLSYSAENIAQCYQTPLAVYSDQGIRLVDDASDVVAFWKEAVKPYQGMGIANSAPKILSQEHLSETISTAKVSWSNTDAFGKVVATETNFYVLAKDHDEWKIRGLILMTKPGR